MLIGMRNQARADKNFALSDQIRDQLIAGIN
jgi:cysteinyl-tRNA synthetase